MTSIRLNKYLSDGGICSRRQADEHILAGEVKVNGARALLGQKIDPSVDRVEFKNETVSVKKKNTYYALNKPRGVVSTASDEMGRKSVIDLVPNEPRVYPVGRLDRESEGLIVLTDDGELAQKLTHPSFKHEKEYELFASETKKKTASTEQLEKSFLAGMRIDGKLMKADSIKVSLIRETRYSIRIVIHTGYNRQLRRMCGKMGLEVLKLRRIRIAKLSLDKLSIKPGEYKEVIREDIL